MCDSVRLLYLLTYLPAEAPRAQPLDAGLRPAALEPEAVVAKVAAQVLARDAARLELASVPA